MVIDIVGSSMIRECEMIVYELRDSMIDISLGGRTLRIVLKNVPKSFNPDDNDAIAKAVINFLTRPESKGGLIVGVGRIIDSYGYHYDILLI